VRTRVVRRCGLCVSPSQRVRGVWRARQISPWPHDRPPSRSVRRESGSRPRQFGPQRATKGQRQVVDQSENNPRQTYVLSVQRV
jgi:hypothetical protein